MARPGFPKTILDFQRVPATPTAGVVPARDIVLDEPTQSVRREIAEKIKEGAFALAELTG